MAGDRLEIRLLVPQLPCLLRHKVQRLVRERRHLVSAFLFSQLLLASRSILFHNSQLFSFRLLHIKTILSLLFFSSVRTTLVWEEAFGLRDCRLEIPAP